MMFTSRPKTGIGKKLTDAELEEFNQINYDKIKRMDNLPKLMRLEQYMREEGFPQTSELTRQRIIELGGKDSCPNDWKPQFADRDAEFDSFLNTFDSWQASVKDADKNLCNLHLANEDGEPCETEKSKSNVKDQKKQREVIEISMNFETPKKVQKKDVRSGRAYYDQWDKYVVEAEKEIEEDGKENKPGSKPRHAKNGNKENETIVAKKDTIQQRLLSIGKSKSMTERQWFAEREREKGNDLFHAKEYTSSLDSYTMAIELYPGSVLAYGNRAAVNLKLKRWEEAHHDCCKALELDASYMKALMRRGLANLEMDRPEEAIKDLRASSTLDPNNQETQSLMRRTELVLKKKEEKLAEELETKKKHDEELELKRQHDKELECQRKEVENRELETISSKSTFASRRSTRMQIEDVEDSSNTGDSICTSSNQHKDEGEGKNEAIDEAKRKEAKIHNWPSRPHKHNTRNTKMQPLNGESEASENSMMTQIVGATQDGQKNLKDDDKKFGAIIQQESKRANGQVVVDKVVHPPEVLGAMEAQGSLLDGNDTHGKVPKIVDCDHRRAHGNKSSIEASDNNMSHYSTNSDATTSPTVSSRENVSNDNLNHNVVGNHDMLAKEWRLNGNSFFARGDIKRAEESYTTSLKYCRSAVTLSNRAMCRIKLKNYNGAEQDASDAISMDPKFHKAYYRRGLARRQLGRLRAAQEDFQEVLKASPGDKNVMVELESLESEYIPMRHGPMTFEEIDDQTDTIVPSLAESSSEASPRPTRIASKDDLDTQNSSEENARSHPPTQNPQSEHTDSHDDIKTSQNNASIPQPEVEAFQEGQRCSPDCSESSQSVTSSPRPEVEFHHLHDHQKPQDTIEVNQNHLQNSTELKEDTDPQACNKDLPTRDSPDCHVESNSMQPLEPGKVHTTDVDLDHRADEEKEKGNAFFKKGQYTLAIECYSRSLEISPMRATILANRALCYIHLKEFKKAINDSTKAIHLAPGYTKSYHRRAVALHKLGDLYGALNDYQVVATFSPQYKKLKKDIKDLEKEIDRRANTKATTPNPPKRVPVLTSAQSPDDEALMKPLKTTIYITNNASLDAASNQQAPETLPGNVGAPIASGACDSPRVEATAAAWTDASTTTPINTALCARVASAKKAVTAVPQKPKTTLEFERTCGMLKGNPKLAREYVKTIEAKKYPELFKESFTASILQCFVYVLRKGFMPEDAVCFVYVLRKGFMPEDAVGAVAVLQGLTKVKRFSLTLLLMASVEKQGLETIFDWLAFASDAPSSEVQELRSVYCIT